MISEAPEPQSRQPSRSGGKSERSVSNRKKGSASKSKDLASGNRFRMKSDRSRSKRRVKPVNKRPLVDPQDKKDER